MKFLHTADIHLGQIIYQNYDRSDEHNHFFNQLKKWCIEHKPDALLISGDIFDTQQPSAATKKAFTEYFVEIHNTCPDTPIIIIAGNHDSASRIQADSAVWKLANTTIIGCAPSALPTDGWEERYIIRLRQGYIIALPYMTSERTELIQHLLNVVAKENYEKKPVVMMGHTAVTGLDLLGHNIEIGNLKTQDTASFGSGYDYLALGHIHKPQTIGHQEDAFELSVTYPSPVIRYSGSALHVSCDETFPHTVSLVEINEHKGDVKINQLRINELRHFHILPQDGSSFTNCDDILNCVKEFCHNEQEGYIRLQIDNSVDLPSNFNQMIYDTLSATKDEVRYNPKIIWTGKTNNNDDNKELPSFEIAELQQMTNPLEFIERSIEQYPTLNIDEVREAFIEIEEEIYRLKSEEEIKSAIKGRKKTPSLTETTEE